MRLLGFAFLPLFPHSIIKKPLAGKKVVVAGGTSGIGAAVAKEFERLGATVVRMGRRVETSRDDLTVKMNVCDSFQIMSGMKDARDMLGDNVDYFVDTVGSLEVNDPRNMSAAEINAYNIRNLSAQQFLYTEAYKYMADGGRIALTASMSGVWRYTPMYCAAKAGLEGFMESILRTNRTAQYKPGEKRVKVSVIDAGFTYDTGIPFNDDKEPILSARMRRVIKFFGITPQHCAQNIVSALRRNKFRVLPNWDAQLSTYLHLDRVFGGFIASLMQADKEVSDDAQLFSWEYGFALKNVGERYIDRTIMDWVRSGAGSFMFWK